MISSSAPTTDNAAALAAQRRAEEEAARARAAQEQAAAEARRSQQAQAQKTPPPKPPSDAFKTEGSAFNSRFGDRVPFPRSQLPAGVPDPRRLSRLSPRQQVAAVNASSQSIERFGAAQSGAKSVLDVEAFPTPASSSKDVTAQLAQSFSRLDPQAQRAYADHFAAGMDPTVPISSTFAGHLTQAAENGSGSAFGVQLASALDRGGNSIAAGQVSKAVTTGIRATSAAFQAQEKKVEELDRQMGVALAGFKGTVTGAQYQRMVDDFKERHGYDAEKQKLEQLAEVYAPDLEALSRLDPHTSSSVNPDTHALTELAPELAGDLEGLAGTKAGSQMLARQIAAEGEGEPSLFDQLRNKASVTRDVLASVRAGVVRSVGATALQGAQGGSANVGNAVYAGLKKIGFVFGLDEAQMARFTGTISQFSSGLGTARTEELTQELGDQIDEMTGVEGGKIAQSLKGLGAALASAQAIQGWADFGKADLQERLQTINSTLQLGRDGAEALAKTWTTAAEGTTRASIAGISGSIADAGGPILAGLGALSNSISLSGDLDRGDAGAAVGDSLALVGSVAMLANPVVGGAIVTAGAAVKLFFGEDPPDPFQSEQDDLKSALMKIGVNDRTASALSDLDLEGHGLGPYVEQVAGQTSKQPWALLLSMNDWSDEQLDTFVSGAKDALASAPIDQETGQPKFGDGTVADTAQWLWDEGLVPRLRGTAAAQQEAESRQLARNFKNGTPLAGTIFDPAAMP